MKIIKMDRSRKSLVLFQQLHGISMEESQHEYMLKQQELIDALTDETTELYRTQEATDKKLETILTLITNDPGNIQELERIEKVDRELQNF